MDDLRLVPDEIVIMPTETGVLITEPGVAVITEQDVVDHRIVEA
jgi:hypothetical protein